MIAIELRQQEAALVRAAQKGDRAAFGALYESCERLVYAVLLAHVSYTEVQDLMQDVFVKALERLDGLRDPVAFRAWLIAIARRTALDHVRSAKQQPGPRLEKERRVQPEAEAMEALQAIQRLPNAYRETLILRFVEGMTGPEIAAATGLAPDSVRVNLCRGVKLLRAALEGRKSYA